MRGAQLQELRPLFRPEREEVRIGIVCGAGPTDLVGGRATGGTCALRGCDPKKMLIGGADAFDHARRMHRKGVTGEIHINWQELMPFKRTFTDPVPEKMEQRYRDNGIDVHHGKARFLGTNTVQVAGDVLEGNHILLASGAEPIKLNIPGEQHLMDNEGFLAVTGNRRRPDLRPTAAAAGGRQRTRWRSVEGCCAYVQCIAAGGVKAMCSHYVGQTARAKLARMGVSLPADWEPPPGGMHIYPTQLAPIIRRPPERDSGDEAVPDMEIVLAHFGLLPGFAKDIRYGVRTYNARSETVANLASFKTTWAQAGSESIRS